MEPVRSDKPVFKALAWLACLAFLCFYGAFLLKYNTFYHPDTGWELYSIWSVLQPGRHTDFLMSLRPAYLLNVPFAWLFGINLYALRLVEFGLAIMATLIFMAGLDKRLLKSAALPLSLILVVAMGQRFSDFILCYYNAPWLFLMIALGCYLLGQDSRKPATRSVLFILSGITLAIAAISNIALLPAGILTVIVLTIFQPGKQRWLLLAVFVIALVLMLYAYFDGLGVAQQILAGKTRGAQALWSTVQGQVVVAVVNVVIMAIGTGLSLLVWWGCLRHRQKVTALSWIYGIALLLMTAWIFTLYDRLFFFRDAPYYVAAFLIPFTLITFWRYHEPASKRRILLILVTTLLFALDHGATSQNLFSLIILFYLPALLCLTLYIVWFSTIRPSGWLKTAFFIITFAMLAGPILFYNLYNINKIGIWHNRYRNSLGYQIYPQDGHLWQTVMQQYTAHHCQDKWFLTFYDQPKLYVLLKRLAPFNQSWISGLTSYPQNKAINPTTILATLKQQPAWCVIYAKPLSTFFHITGDLSAVVQYLQTHARQRIPLGQGKGYDRSLLTLFVS